MQYVLIIILALSMLFSCATRGKPGPELPMKESSAPMDMLPRQDSAEAKPPEEKTEPPENSLGGAPANLSPAELPPTPQAVPAESAGAEKPETGKSGAVPDGALSQDTPLQAPAPESALSPGVPAPPDPGAALSLANPIQTLPPMTVLPEIAQSALIPPEMTLKDTVLPNEITPNMRQVPSTISILQNISDSLSTGDYGAAITLFDTIEQQEAQTPQIQLLKASVLLSAGDLKEARAQIQAILVKDAENLDALFLLSILEEADGKEREQYQILERILKKAPGYMDALVSMGQINIKRRSFKNAADYYDRALKVDSKSADALLGRANVYYLTKDNNKAEPLYNQTVSLYPKLAEAYTERARFYRSTGKNSLALADFNTAKNLDSENYWIAIDMGNTLLDLNRKTEALAEFQRAVSLNPDFFLPYVYTAGIRDELRDYNAAEKDYTAIIKIKPTYFYAFEGLGIIKIRKGEWFAARDAFLEAYKREPRETSYALLASISSIKGGRQNEQRQLLNDAMKKVNRESLDWYLLRLYYDYTGSVYTGDSSVVSRLDNEVDSVIKARTTYYLAVYYDLRKNTKLAEKYYLIVRDMQCRSIPEWRLNEIALEERGLKDTGF
ncbi:MAG: tetratricopeptide repeat protein [Treponema sp.]|nr:tetratricopeptide repeat protein [Treponema sp.]